MLASRHRAAQTYDAQEALDDDGDVRVGGDGGETVAFLGETHVAFTLESETYATTLCFAETPECFREPEESLPSAPEKEETADAAADDDTDAATGARAFRPGSVLAQWRAPTAPPVSFRADRRTKNKHPATLTFVVATSETSSDAGKASETNADADAGPEPVPSTTLVGEICLDVALVREAQRAVREARAAARAAEPRRSADAGDDPEADPAHIDPDAAADAAADAASDASAADAKAKAFETARRATALVASLFSTKSASPEDAEPDPEEKEKEASFLFASFPTTHVALSSFLETLEAFVSPELGVVAEDDAAFAAFVKAAVSGGARRERASRRAVDSAADAA